MEAMASSIAPPPTRSSVGFQNLMAGQETNAFFKVGLALTLFQVFAMVARLPEMLSIKFGTSLYFIPILTTILLVIGLVTGAIGRVASTKSGMFWLLFLFWVVITLPFSGNKGGSLGAWIEVMKRAPLLFFVGGFASQSPKSLRQTVWAFIWTGVTVLLWVAFFGETTTDDNDRLSSDSRGTFGNANELAMMMTFLIPFVGFVAGNSRYKLITRLISGLLIPVCSFIALRTGSRGGLLSLVMMGMIVFWKGSATNKIRIIVVGVMLALVMFPLIPEKNRQRLSTLFSSDVRADTESVASANSRRDLLIESIQTTIRHPLTGVGLGVYLDVVGAEAVKEGRTVHWQVSHNAYTEISAETGVIGLILWLSAIVFSFKHLSYARRVCQNVPELAEMSAEASAVTMSLTMFMFNGLFTSMATSHTLFALCGFSIATYFVARRYETNSRLFANAASQAQGSEATSSEQKRLFDRDDFQTHGLGTSDHPAPTSGKPYSTTTLKAEAKALKAKTNQDAPWRRNPRKYPPPPGTPSR